MTAGRNEFIRRIVGAGQGTVREQVAVKVVAYAVSVKHYQPVACIVCKATVRRIGNIACRIIAEGFFRQDRIAQVLCSTFGYTAKAIISITHFGRICKCLDEKQPHPKVRLNICNMFLYYALYKVFMNSIRNTIRKKVIGIPSIPIKILMKNGILFFVLIRLSFLVGSRLGEVVLPFLSHIILYFLQ